MATRPIEAEGIEMPVQSRIPHTSDLPCGALQQKAYKALLPPACQPGVLMSLLQSAWAQQTFDAG